MGLVDYCEYLVVVGEFYLKQLALPLIKHAHVVEWGRVGIYIAGVAYDVQLIALAYPYVINPSQVGCIYADGLWFDGEGLLFYCKQLHRYFIFGVIGAATYDELRWSWGGTGHFGGLKWVSESHGHQPIESPGHNNPIGVHHHQILVSSSPAGIGDDGFRVFVAGVLMVFDYVVGCIASDNSDISIALSVADCQLAGGGGKL